MGNPDLVVVINNSAYIIKGTEYDQRHQAVQQAISKFDKYQEDIDKLRHNENGSLYKEADPNWFPEEIETIRLYNI